MGEGGVGWMIPTDYPSLSLNVNVVVEQSALTRSIFDGADDANGSDGVESVRITDNHGVEACQWTVLSFVVGDVLDDVHHLLHFAGIESLCLEKPLNLVGLTVHIGEKFLVNAVVQPCRSEDYLLVSAFLQDDFLGVCDDSLRMLMVVSAMVLRQLLDDKPLYDRIVHVRCYLPDLPPLRVLVLPLLPLLVFEGVELLGCALRCEELEPLLTFCCSFFC